MRKVSHKNAVNNAQKQIKRVSRSLYVPDPIWRALLIHRAVTPGAKSVNQYIVEATVERMKRDGIKVEAAA